MLTAHQFIEGIHSWVSRQEIESTLSHLYWDKGTHTAGWLGVCALLVCSTSSWSPSSSILTGAISDTREEEVEEGNHWNG